MGKLQFSVVKKWAISAGEDGGFADFEEWQQSYPKYCEELLEIHRLYRSYKTTHEDHTEIDSTQGVIPKKIIQKLESISSFYTDFVDFYETASEMEGVKDLISVYPGLEIKDVKAESISLERIELNTEFDLENPDERIFPKIKWAQGNFVFNVNFTPEEFEARKAMYFRGLWTDAYLILGGNIYRYEEKYAVDFQYHD